MAAMKKRNVILPKQSSSSFCPTVSTNLLPSSSLEEGKSGGNRTFLIDTSIITAGVSEKVLIRSVTHLVEYANYVTSPEGNVILLLQRDFKLRLAKPQMQDLKSKPFMCAVCGDTFGHGKLQELESHVSAVHGFSNKKSSLGDNGGEAGGSQGAVKVKIDLENCSKSNDTKVNDFGQDSKGTDLKANVSERDKFPQISRSNRKCARKKRGAIYPKRLFPCDFCDAVFHGANSLGKHQQVKHKGMKHQCSICEKGFALGKKCLLKEHALTHIERGETQEKPGEICTICGQNFGHKPGLNNRMKCFHPKEFKANLMAICKMCGKRFTSEKGLAKHVSLVHTDEKRFQCDVCGRKFKTRVYLEIHNRQHTAEKPHKCAYCDRQFATHKRRLVHERAHRREKPYKCTKCPKAYPSRTMLNEHVNWHAGLKPYACSLCSATFASTSEKRTHERRHMGIKPYKCSYCERSFVEIINKEKHETVHTGEKLYKCTKCDSSFQKRNCLQLHLAKQHNINLPGYQDDYGKEKTSELIQVEGAIVGAVKVGAVEMASDGTQPIPRE